ncbi:MAG TPA: SRPBCC domain-containing protein [Candidatus Aquilonibacter sp.]|nr:SRPBCC domain-containing protein [Candidatus Aquilonibacter sp.]
MSNAAETPSSLVPASLVVERIFPHPPEKLWRALTESPLLAEWMMNNDFEPSVGRKFQFRADPAPNWNGIVDCEVLAIDPRRSLSYIWSTGPAEYGMRWTVHFTLTPADGGTQLRMEQSGFRPDQQQAYGGAKYGWQRFFSNLERVLGGGVE